MLFIQYELMSISWALMLFVQYAVSLVIQISKMPLNNFSKNYVIDYLHHVLPYVFHAEKFEWPEVLDRVR